MNFTELGICPEILRALTDLGFTTPTPIQEQSIPALLTQQKDYVGLAQTGTGKTAAFGVPLITKIDLGKVFPQGLILCPTRELCLQITKELRAYSAYLPLKVLAIYGGTSIMDQIRQLKDGVHIVVGTPGRVIDLLDRNVLHLKNIQTVVLDEADEMLNKGFEEDINTILAKTPSSRNTWLFSATMPNSVEQIANHYMNNPLRVTVGSRNGGARNITHHYSMVSRHNVYEALRRFIDFSPQLFGMLFCRTRRDAKEIAEKLTKDGYQVEALHGDLSQAQRDVIMQKFRDQQIQLLVATDVAARGIDVNNVTHIIHHNIPEDIEVYTHRSGRTARAGKSGISWTVVSGQKDVRRLRLIERQIGLPITPLPIPHAQQVTEKQIEHFTDVIRSQEIDEQALALQSIRAQLSDLPAEQLIDKLLMLAVGKKVLQAKSLPDINGTGQEHRTDREHYEPMQQRSYAKGSGTIIQLNIGNSHGVDIGRLLNFICTTTNINGRSLGKIIIQRNLSFVSVDDDSMAEKIITALQNNVYNGRKMAIERVNRIPRDMMGGGAPRSKFNKDKFSSHARSGEQRTPFSQY
jgi:ATP-dependent RNA helicase DeaD